MGMCICPSSRTGDKENSRGVRPEPGTKGEDAPPCASRLGPDQGRIRNIPSEKSEPAPFTFPARSC